MCIDTFLGSHNPLPVITFDEDNPTFYTQPIDDEENSIAKKYLGSNNVYFVGSFMGCSCGLSFGNWSLDDEHMARIRDVNLLLNYLITYSKQNVLKLLYLDYDSIEATLPEKEFNPRNYLNVAEFDLQSNIIYLVVTSHE